jgi:Fe-S cluster biogenesis protein NfuA
MAEPATAAADIGACGLSDEQVRERLTRLDELLGKVELLPGPDSELALDAVAALTDIYGEALRRLLSRCAADPHLLAQLREDELVGHLMLLHELNPEPVEARVARALDEVRPYVHSHGGEISLLGVESGVATVRLSGSCEGCSASAATLQLAVTEAVLTFAPELTGVEAEQPDHPVASHAPPAGTRLLPLEAVRHPAAAGGPR